MVEFQDAGAEVFDYGNSIRDEARQGGYERAFEFPGFVPAYIRPLFCEGKGPFRWVALSGDPHDIDATDRAVMELFPDNDRLQKWMRGARERIAFQGLPARICWLGYGERDRAGLAFNDLVASGEISAPIVIGRDHLDCGSVASPYRETESMVDGSDAIADWPLLNALINTASGATWVSIHHGGGVGIGRSIHAGQVSLADGTELAAQKLARVLTNDPGMGVIRHVDAGYDRADEVAAERGVRIPMQESDAEDRVERDADASTRCGRRSPTSAADPPTGGYRRFALDAGRSRAAGVVRRRGGGARAGPDRGPDGQPVGLVGRSGCSSARAWSPARTWTACPTAARSTARSGVVSAFAAIDGCAHGGSGPPGRSASSTSSTRKVPASASPAPAPG